jgi:tol-pal system protein YbgF
VGRLRWYRIPILWGECIGLLLLLTACPNTGQDKSLTQIRSQLSVLSNEMQKSFEESEKERIDLYKQLNNDVKVLRKNQADTSAISDELRASLTAIDAKLDEYNERMERLGKHLDLVEKTLTERIAFLSDQVSEIGKDTTISSEIPSDQQQPSTWPTPQVESTPSQQSLDMTEVDKEESQFYHKAYTAYVNGDFDTAIAGFERYLELYPDTEFADIAQYWIAESFFSLGEYETALREYDKFIAQYPNSDKIPAAYLSKAEVYLQLDRRLEANSHLQYIINRFPETDTARKAEERLRSIERGP